MKLTSGVTPCKFREDGVCYNSFTASGDVENRIARFKVLFDVILGMWSNSMAGGDIESVLDAMSMQRMGIEHSSQALGVNSDGDWL